MISKNIIETAIACVVCVVIVVTMAIPILDDSVKSFETEYNNSLPYYAQIVDEDYELVKTSSTVTINGDALTLDPDVSGYPVIVSDSLYINTNQSSGYMYNIRFASHIESQVTACNINIDASEKTISVTDIVSGAGEYEDFTVTYQVCYAVSAEETDLVCFNKPSSGTVSAYVNSPSDVIAITYVSNSDVLAIGNKVYSDTVTIDYDLDAVEDMYNLKTVTLGPNNSDCNVLFVSNNNSYAPGSIIVPSSVQGVTTNDGPIYTIIGIMPLLIVVGLIVGIIGTIFVTRGDNW